MLPALAGGGLLIALIVAFTAVRLSPLQSILGANSVGVIAAAFIGTVCVGALLGEVLHRAFRLSYYAADSASLIVLVLASGFTGEDDRRIGSTMMFYLIVARPAHFVIAWWHTHE